CGRGMHRRARGRSPRPLDRRDVDRRPAPGDDVPSRRRPRPARDRQGRGAVAPCRLGGRGMIVDVHSHVWRYPDHIDEVFMDGLRLARPGVKIDITVDFDPFMAAMAPCDRVIFFGMRALKTGLHVPNEFIAGFAARAPQKLIGFMSIDPNEPEWRDDFERSHRDLKLKGVKLGPIYAGFDPTDPALDPLYAGCVKHDLPVLIHVGTSFVRFGPLEWSRPLLVDAVARKFPDLRIIMAHLGHPWESETIAVIRKHPHVYADVSALHCR